jgi:RimJ/RimL family protein N-acetyltransferase
MLRYGFTELGFDEITASTDALNLASQRVMQKIAMTFDRRASGGQGELLFFKAKRGWLSEHAPISA